jgi:hypothetical protein
MRAQMVLPSCNPVLSDPASGGKPVPDDAPPVPLPRPVVILGVITADDFLLAGSEISFNKK